MNLIVTDIDRTLIPDFNSPITEEAINVINHVRLKDTFCLSTGRVLGNVFHLYSYWIVLVIVTVTLLIVNRQLFRAVDYSLLFTFVGFFIFIGNMKQVEVIHILLTSIIEGNEFMTGVKA